MVLAGEAIELLGTLRLSDEWKTQGIGIVERHDNGFTLDEPTRPKRSRNVSQVRL